MFLQVRQISRHVSQEKSEEGELCCHFNVVFLHNGNLPMNYAERHDTMLKFPRSVRTESELKQAAV